MYIEDIATPGIRVHIVPGIQEVKNKTLRIEVVLWAFSLIVSNFLALPTDDLSFSCSIASYCSSLIRVVWSWFASSSNVVASECISSASKLSFNKAISLSCSLILVRKVDFLTSSISSS